MMHRLLACLAFCLALSACETPRFEPNGPRAEATQPQPVRQCSPVSGRPAVRIEAITRAILGRPEGERVPTAQERAELAALAEEAANMPETLDAQGRVYCRFQSARAANLALWTAQPGDARLIDQLSGAKEAVASECGALQGEPSATHCRQLDFFAAIGRSRSAGHPLIVMAQGTAEGADAEKAALGFADFGEIAKRWPDVMARLRAANAPGLEQEGIHREFSRLACQVRDAGLRMQRPSFGLSDADADRIEAATRRGESLVAQGLELKLRPDQERVCAADGDSPACQGQHQALLIEMCMG